MKHRTSHHHSSPWMLLACILPMGLLFILPALGVNIGAFWLLFPLLCAGSHFHMMQGHHQETHEKHPHELPDERRED